MAQLFFDLALPHDILMRREDFPMWGRRAVDSAIAAGKPIDAFSVYHWIGKTAPGDVNQLRIMNPALYHELCYEAAVEAIASVVHRAMFRIN